MPGRSLHNHSYAAVRVLDECVDPHALHRFSPVRYPFFLQSTAQNASLGRYDILFACPGDELVLDNVGDLDHCGGFLTTLDDWWRREFQPVVDSVLPFSGGWFVYLGYELAGEVEPALSLCDDPSLPAAFAVRCTAAIVRDNMSGACWLVHEKQAHIDEDAILSDISACNRLQTEQDDPLRSAPHVEEEPPKIFTDAVTQAKEHIAAGDIYQANLSRAWSAGVDENLDSNQVYLALRASNPGPFAGLIRWQDTTVISSSPERLLRIKNNIASTRPIAGTRPRSDDQLTDDSLSAELFAHPKERAEHIMLIDLERNDLGRVCEPGSVEVDEMMVLETYAHVHHIVSNIRGTLRAGVSPGEAIRAVFPGGTITGCPKVRCMEIIRELECGPRGAYTGSFGYLNRDGSLDLNILIRTMVSKGKEITFRAGAGIVADSEPAAELHETRAKAKGMLRALCQ